MRATALSFISHSALARSRTLQGVGGILVAIGIVLAVRACKRARRAPQVPSGKVIDEHSAKQKQVTAEVEYVIDGQIPGDQV